MDCSLKPTGNTSSGASQHAATPQGSYTCLVAHGADAIPPECERPEVEHWNMPCKDHQVMNSNSVKVQGVATLEVSSQPVCASWIPLEGSRDVNLRHGPPADRSLTSGLGIDIPEPIIAFDAIPCVSKPRVEGDQATQAQQHH